jgi:hypothetical protein
MIDQYPPANGVLTSLIWRKTAAGGETSLSGYDNASQALSYTPGQEQVYLNGILLVRGDDYTATNGTSITGLAALSASDFVQINCYNNFSVATLPTSGLTGTISNAQLQNSSITINGSAVSLGGTVTLAGDIESVTATSPLTGGGSTGALTVGIQEASTSQRGSVQLSDSTSTTSSVLAATPTAVKSAYDLANGAIPKTLTTTTGDIIYASSANTPARLGIGSTDQVLKVSGGIPSWATPSSGGFTQLVSATSFGNVSSVTMSNISQDYKDLRIIVKGWSNAGGGNIRLQLQNTDTGYMGMWADYRLTWYGTRTNSGLNYFRLGDSLYSTVTGTYIINILDYTSSTLKHGNFSATGLDAGSGADGGTFGFFCKGSNAGLTSITLISENGNYDAGTYELWGIK